MSTLRVKRTTLNEMHKHCTSELLSRIFSVIGSDNIVVLDKNDDDGELWDITDFMDAERCDLLDRLKVIYVFTKISDSIHNLKYGEDHVPYQVLFRILKKTEPNTVLLYWRNNEANDVLPIYDVGEIEIPRIMPRYTCTQVASNLFRVDKWYKGEYVPTPEIYPTKELCQDRVDELNREYS